MTATRLNRLAAPLAVLIAVCLAGTVMGCGVLNLDIGWTPSGSGQDAPTDAESAAAQFGIDVVRASDLPPEARVTLQLIEEGGPCPYSRDGAVFHNYEGLLPNKGDGYYREYTVNTPDSSDRGARRIVAGKGDERYYTDDHYNSFRLVVE
jgi:ribonuclease T1